VGEPKTAREHADKWATTALEALASLGLDVGVQAANDPFFGAAGDLLAQMQRIENRKTEVVTIVPGYAAPTAIASSNWHKDHFAADFSIELADGQVAHSSCVGFGLDRIALALLAVHGFDPEGWPSAVRSQLWPSTSKTEP